MNSAFRDSQSDTQYSLYVGSYGRGTAVNTSDIDILVELPEDEYNRYDTQKGNGQSRLLQAVKNAILTSYPRSDVRADGQVVKVNFSDGILFEILPAFRNLDGWDNWNGTYKYPDSNMGGNWRSTNPKAEIDAVANKNSDTNGLLRDTCRHIRRIRDDFFSSYTLSGIVIDSFVYNAMGNWRWLNVSPCKSRFFRILSVASTMRSNAARRISCQGESRRLLQSSNESLPRKGLIRARVTGTGRPRN